MNLAVRLLVGVAWVMALVAGSVSAEEPRHTIEQTADQTVVRVLATDQKVSSEDLIAALTEVADLDGQVLIKRLPHGDLDLTKRRTLASLHLVEKSLKGRAEIGVERDANGVVQALLVVFDRAKIEQGKLHSKETSRKWIKSIGAATGHSVEELAWGLRGLDTLMPKPGQPVIVLIHGFQGNHDSLADLQQILTQNEFANVTFAYPNDGAIADAARQLAVELREATVLRDSPLILVTHSMGGLVARRLIEDPDLDDRRVRQLLMIAPPNGGSNLAYLPFTTDWYEHLKERPVDGLPDFVFRSSMDGLNEAQHDLRPDSRFLLDLNARPRNPRVRYSILLGTKSPATPEQLDSVSRKLESLTNKSDTVQLFAPRLRKIFDHPLELTPGSGDGAVAVERGQLVGVDDVVTLPTDHWTATKTLDTEEGRQLVQEVLQRLR